MSGKSSAEKRHRQSEKHRLRNRTAKSQVKTEIKKFLQIVVDKDVAKAEGQYKFVSKLIDTAAGKGLYHKNNAARKKARLYQNLNKITASAGT
ncbi:MAG: 30S ribosomal protein S20 [Spirochaetales bacterium]|nr:MAG: 30S ribosomal protein S20 [Spirochaetales bacterium]